MIISFLKIKITDLSKDTLQKENWKGALPEGRAVHKEEKN
jgi:hypothetical protein